jgi:hypothetical protein
LKTIPYKGYENVIAATDFLHGILFWNLTESECEDELTLEKNVCYYEKPLYRVRFDKLASMTVMPADNLGEEKVIFATVVSPPKVIEITFDSVERPPYVSRIYSLSS